MVLKATFSDVPGRLYTRERHKEEFTLIYLRQNGVNADVSPELLEKQLNLKSETNQGLLNYVAYLDEFLSMRSVLDRHQRTPITT